MSAPTSSRHWRWGVLVLGTSGLLSGLAARAAAMPRASNALLAATTCLGIALSAWWMISAARSRRFGVDVIALAALVGTWLTGEHVAGAVITVMLTTGRALEAWAEARAERELHSLLARAPQVAHRYVDGELTQPALSDVVVGDLLLCQPGEVVPVDGIVRSREAVTDDSAITGESTPVVRVRGDAVRAGATNTGAPFDLLATTSAADSTYAEIVRLVEHASASTSRVVRSADRLALLFVGFTFATALAASVSTGDSGRAVAVLVVATPCPLILAAPVAIVSGLSRAARRGVVIKGGAALEALADGEILLLDKTGTITSGRPKVVDVISADGSDGEVVLRRAAAVDQVSPHVLAAAIVVAATERHLDLPMPTDSTEIAGMGAVGTVEGHRIAVGNGRCANVVDDEPWVLDARRRSEIDGASTVFVAVDGVAVGAIILADPIRPDAARTIRNLRRSGIRRVVMVTGDRAEVAASVAEMIGVDDVRAQQSPADKVAVVEDEGRGGATVMVGDGINDAPALAAAGVGVAVGSRGSTASSEVADIVLTVDHLDRLGEARLIARRSRAIAHQSIIAGISMSVIAMGGAAAGLLHATEGAVLQELIDVAVILNAIRALRPGRGERRLSAAGSVVAEHFRAQHDDLHPRITLLRQAADELGRNPAAAMETVRAAHRFLVEQVEPHEISEDHDLYPLVADVIGGLDPTVTMSRTHTEISQQTRRLGLIIDRVGRQPPNLDDVLALQRILYGLHAVLELHFAQEDENYLALADRADERGG